MPAATTIISYPSTSGGFLEVDVYDTTLAAGVHDLVTALYVGSSTKPDEDVAYRDGAFRGSYARYSTVTGLGTIASPFRFRIRPFQGWRPGTTNTLLPRITENSAGVSASTQPPAGHELRLQLRWYVHQAMGFFTAGIADLSVDRAKYLDCDLQCVIEDFSATNLALFTTCKNRALAASPPFGVYPAFRLYGGTALTMANVVDPAYYVPFTAGVVALAALRSPGDPRIAIDAEMYTNAVEEVSEASVVAAGYTWSQYVTAITPLIDALNSVGAYVTIYPQEELADLAEFNAPGRLLLNTLGTDRVEMSGYRGFRSSEEYRKGVGPAYPDGVPANSRTFAEQIAAIGADSGSISHVYGSAVRYRTFVDDDILRVWGDTYRKVFTDQGIYAPVVFDRTRLDKTITGTAAWRLGTSLYSANAWDYVWEFPPMSVAPSQTSVGAAATAITPAQLYGTTSPASSVIIAPVVVRDVRGWRIDPGQVYDRPLDAFGMIQLFEALPVTATASPRRHAYYSRFQLDRALATNLPIMGSMSVNFFIHQLEIDSATMKLFFRTNTERFEICAGPLPVGKGNTYKVLVNRSADTAWKFMVGISAAARAPDVFTLAGSVVTLTMACAPFGAWMVGLPIVVINADGTAVSGNNGTFTIASVISPTQVTYSNAAGVHNQTFANLGTARITGARTDVTTASNLSFDASGRLHFGAGQQVSGPPPINNTMVSCPGFILQHAASRRSALTDQEMTDIHANQYPMGRGT